VGAKKILPSFHPLKTPLSLSVLSCSVVQISECSVTDTHACMQSSDRSNELGLAGYLILLEESAPVVGLDELLSLRVAQSNPVVEIA